jgi:hypothetical protein
MQLLLVEVAVVLLVYQVAVEVAERVVILLVGLTLQIL